MTDHSTAQPPADAGTDTFCPQCGYNLRGLAPALDPSLAGHGHTTGASPRCPECGLTIDAQILSLPNIPWEHRSTLGAWRAYWRTVRHATSHPIRFARESAKPLRYSDARRFQLVTVTLTWLPIAVAILWLYLRIIVPPHFSGMAALGWILEWLTIAASLAAVWLFLLMATGIHTYLFHPRRLTPEQQDRAITIAYYAPAPLAYGFPVALISLLAGAALELAGPLVSIGWTLLAASLFLGLVPPTLVYTHTLLFLCHSTHCGTGRILTLAVILPVAWILVAVVAGLLPFAVAYISLFALSILG